MTVTRAAAKRLHFELTGSQEKIALKQDSDEYVPYVKRVKMGSRKVVDLTRENSSTSSSSSRGAESLSSRFHGTVPSSHLGGAGSSSSSGVSSSRTPETDKVQELVGYLSTLSLIPKDGQPETLKTIHKHFIALKGFQEVAKDPGIDLSVKTHFWFRCAQCYAFEHLGYAAKGQVDQAKERLDKAIHFLDEIHRKTPPSPWPSAILSLAAVLRVRRNNPEDESSMSDVATALRYLEPPYTIANSPSVRAPLYYHMALEFQKIGRNNDYIEFLRRAKEQPFVDHTDLLHSIDASLSQALHEQSLLKRGK